MCLKRFTNLYPKIRTEYSVMSVLSIMNVLSKDTGFNFTLDVSVTTCVITHLQNYLCNKLANAYLVQFLQNIIYPISVAYLVSYDQNIEPMEPYICYGFYFGMLFLQVCNLRPKQTSWFRHNLSVSQNFYQSLSHKNSKNHKKYIIWFKRIQI